MGYSTANPRASLDAWTKWLNRRLSALVISLIYVMHIFQLSLHVKCYVTKAYFESRLIALKPITACFFLRGNAVKWLLLLQEKVES